MTKLHQAPLDQVINEDIVEYHHTIDAWLPLTVRDVRELQCKAHAYDEMMKQIFLLLEDNRSCFWSALVASGVQSGEDHSKLAQTLNDYNLHRTGKILVKQPGEDTDLSDNTNPFQFFPIQDPERVEESLEHDEKCFGITQEMRDAREKRELAEAVAILRATNPTQKFDDKGRLIP